MNGWKQIRFGDLIENKTSFPLKKGKTYSNIPMENVIEGQRSPAKISSKEFNGSGSRFKNDDTLFARITPCLQNRKIAYASNLDNDIGFGSTEFFVFRAKNSLTDSKFIYYLSNFSELRRTAELSMTGASGRQRADLNVILDFEVFVPENPKERLRIANVISSYDDLVENNLKRIKILEEMAQRLYTEWFVKFKFPGHEKVKMVDSMTEFGMIPDGWEVKRLSEFASLTMGQSPKSEFYNENGEGLPFHQGVSNFGYLYPENKVYSSKGNRIAKKGDLLFSVRAPVGKLNISTCEMILGRGLASIRHKQNRQSFLLSMFFNKFTENDMLGNGSIYKSINKSELENLLFVVPSEKLMEIFEPISKKYFEKLNILTQRVTNLSRTRDLLVENLVTGKRLLKN